MSRAVAKRASLTPVARKARQHGREVAREQALREAMRRAGADLREQMGVLLRILGHAYAAVELVDEMRAAGELAGEDGGRQVSSRWTLSDLGLSRRRVSDWRSLKDLGATGFIEEALQDERAATLERASVYWLRKRLERIAREGGNGAELAEPDDSHEIRHGDFRDVLDDLAGTVDAIITDPPYPAKFIDEFDALGAKAAELLTPTGLFVAMVGQSHLPAYIERLSRHLDYRWTAAYLTEGPATRIHGRKVGTKWKPLLIYDRAPKDRGFITQDVFTSARDDKQHHSWGQSESGMADVVERLTEAGQLVVDPFLGGGTTAVVCRDLGRRFVGCDVDPNAVHITQERLA